MDRHASKSENNGCVLKKEVSFQAAMDEAEVVSEAFNPRQTNKPPKTIDRGTALFNFIGIIRTN
jgi:hypothetical protein